MLHNLPQYLDNNAIAFTGLTKDKLCSSVLSKWNLLNDLELLIMNLFSWEQNL